MMREKEAAREMGQPMETFYLVDERCFPIRNRHKKYRILTFVISIYFLLLSFMFLSIYFHPTIKIYINKLY